MGRIPYELTDKGREAVRRMGTAAATAEALDALLAGRPLDDDQRARLEAHAHLLHAPTR